MVAWAPQAPRRPGYSTSTHVPREFAASTRTQRPSTWFSTMLVTDVATRSAASRPSVMASMVDPEPEMRNAAAPAASAVRRMGS